MAEVITKKYRVEEIDIIKGLGIVLMVMGHSGSYSKNYVYLFHMAIFFIASGFVYKTIDTKSLKNIFDYCLKRIKYLYIPYVVWSIIYSLLHNVFIRLNIYTLNPDIVNYSNDLYDAPSPTSIWSLQQILVNCAKSFLLEGRTQLGGTFWFLKVLLFVSLGYGIVDFLMRKYLPQINIFISQFALSFLLLAVGYFLSIKDNTLHGIAQTCSVYILYHIGRMIKEWNALAIPQSVIIRIALLVGSFGLLLILNKMGTVSLGSNKYVNPAFYLSASLLGFVLLYEISYFIKQFNYLKKFFIILGQNTLSVAILHFLCFKLVSFVAILIMGEPSYSLAAFPVLYVGSFWWVLYTIVGVILPVVLSVVYKHLKEVLNVCNLGKR